MIQATAFRDDVLLATGPLPDVALAVRADRERHSEATHLVFDDRTGRVIDLDLRGSDSEIVMRLAPTYDSQGSVRAGRGRPALGVVPREVTLLPAQWDWLAAQGRNVSATLRRLVEDARRAEAAQPSRRPAQEAAYRFATAMAGNLPGYEEAMRALFAGDATRFARQTEMWPSDIRDHSRRLAFPV